jgi:hypothetical protein
MGKLLRATLNLSATPIIGRFTIKFTEMEVVRRTPKTVIVRTNFGESRHQTSEFMKVFSDFKNDHITRLQFYTTFLEEDRKEAVKQLIDHIKGHVNFLDSQNKKAMEALEKDPKII